MQSAWAPVSLLVSVMVLCRILMLLPQNRIPSPSPSLGLLIVVLRKVMLEPSSATPGASGSSATNPSTTTLFALTLMPLVTVLPSPRKVIGACWVPPVVISSGSPRRSPVTHIVLPAVAEADTRWKLARSVARWAQFVCGGGMAAPAGPLAAGARGAVSSPPPPHPASTSSATRPTARPAPHRQRREDSCPRGFCSITGPMLSSGGNQPRAYPATEPILTQLSGVRAATPRQISTTHPVIHPGNARGHDRLDGWTSTPRPARPVRRRMRSAR